MVENALARYLASRKSALADDAPKKKDDECCPAELQAAAEDLLAALGQDYGNSPTATEGSRMEFQDKAKRLGKALHAAFLICESMPHPEAGE